MKNQRNGQATPCNAKSFRQIYGGFRSDAHRLFWAIAWYTGERPSAVLKLRVGDVFGSAAPRRVLPSITFPGQHRKDGRSRTVPVSSGLAPFLQALPVPDDGWLFPSPRDRSQPLGLRAMDRAFRRAIARSNLENRGYSLYSARRGFCTELVSKGYSLRVVQELTGHRSIANLARYVDVGAAVLQAAVDAL
ncbi:MAG: site-specific integrase [Cyanobacteria bacterium]|nr:site-specific integrase [Cyanobacteriota bacterium]